MNDRNQESFRPETVQAIMKTAFKDPSTKINSQALLLSCEFLRLFTTEAVHRSAEELAKQHDDQSLPDRIGVEHLERSVVQLLLDF